MTSHKKYALIILITAVLTLGTAGYGLAEDAQRHVVGE